MQNLSSAAVVIGALRVKSLRCTTVIADLDEMQRFTVC